MINTHICSECNKEKNVTEFHIHLKTNKPVKKCNSCKLEAKSKRGKFYNKQNKQLISEKRSSYYKNYNEKNREIKREKARVYSQQLDVKVKQKKTRESKKKEIAERNKNYVKLNKDKVRLYLKKYRKIKLKDPVWRSKQVARDIIRKSFRTKNFSKRNKTINILGCTYQEFKLHIESQFESWMNWDNYGLYNGTPDYGWDIDHIEPICRAKTIDDANRLNHYTNLRPLCSYVNRVIKRDNYTR